jgi:hypothetical protein
MRLIACAPLDQEGAAGGPAVGAHPAAQAGADATSGEGGTPLPAAQQDGGRDEL